MRGRQETAAGIKYCNGELWHEQESLKDKISRYGPEEYLAQQILNMAADTLLQNQESQPGSPLVHVVVFVPHCELNPFCDRKFQGHYSRSIDFYLGEF